MNGFSVSEPVLIAVKAPLIGLINPLTVSVIVSRIVNLLTIPPVTLAADASLLPTLPNVLITSSPFVAIVVNLVDRLVAKVLIGKIKSSIFVKNLEFFKENPKPANLV